MRKVGFIILALILCCGIEGCGNVTNDLELIEFDQEYTLHHKHYDTELMFRSAVMQVMDSLLLLSSYNSDTVCSLYSIHQGMKKVCQYGVLGNGPKEFLQPLLTYSYQKTFGINEINKQELVILEVNAAPQGNLFIKEQKRLKAPYKMKKGELVLPDIFFTRLDSSHYVSLVCSGENNFFSLLDNSLQPIERFGESPIKEDLLPINSLSWLKGRIAAYDGTMSFVSNKLPYIACYRLESGKMHKVWSFYYRKPHYSIKNSDLLFDKEKSFGEVFDLRMDEQYIYALFRPTTERI